MLPLLQFLAARAAEPSTYASLATALAFIHVNLDPGSWKLVSLYGGFAAAGAGVLLKEWGSGASGAQLLGDAAKAVADAARAANGAASAVLAALMGTGALALMISACAPGMDATVVQALATPSGQLFCRVQLAGGGAIVAGVVAQVATAAAPAGAPLYVIATDSAKAAVDGDCDKAAAAIGGTAGAAVSPPADPAAAPQVMIAAPASNTAGASTPR